ncbi:restriction endonuclease subunit S, partial [Candidatus Pelagibacter ubique]|nr:restriction endonuclease subunit S [Candidatus Pelagibacter ubique]
RENHNYFYQCIEGGAREGQKISEDILFSLEVLVPSEDEIKAIINLDEIFKKKIRSNIKINETLNKISKKIFKSWFIDYEPVKSKVAKITNKFSKEINDLFPDAFEDSELGKIPKSWQIKKLGQILTFLGSGNRPKGGASITDDQVPSVGAENINFIGNYNYSKEKYVPRKFYNKLKEKGISIKNYDILIYKDGANIGRSTIFGKGFPHNECTINEHVHLLRSEKENQKYLYYYLSTEHSQELLISLNTTSAQPGINQTKLKMLNILLPEKHILTKFDEFVTPIVDLIFHNCLENNNLSNLRDALLPNIISGEIEISDAKNLIEEAGI